MLSMQRPRPSMLIAILALRQLPGELLAGELRPLVAVEDVRPSPPQRPLQTLHTELHLHRQRQRPAQYEPAEPVHSSDQIQETLRHPDMRDVRAPPWFLSTSTGRSGGCPRAGSASASDIRLPGPVTPSAARRACGSLHGLGSPTTPSFSGSHRTASVYTARPATA